MNEKCNLFSCFLVKNLRKMALKVAIFGQQTDRYTESAMPCWADEKQKQKQTAVHGAAGRQIKF